MGILIVKFARTALFSLFVVLALAAPTSALGLDEAKAAGAVGERPNGYIGAVGGASGEVKALVSQINTARRQAYARIAKANKAPVASVEKLAGKKLTGRAAAAGHYTMNSGGKWVRK